MISRKSALLISELYSDTFTRKIPNSDIPRLKKESIYDFAFERDYESWFCNLIRTPTYRREFQELLMRLHTGESVQGVTTDWSWEKRKSLGQSYLQYLAKDFLNFCLDQPDDWSKRHYGEKYERLLRQLELDGYILRNGDLLFSESDVLNVREEQGILHHLYSKLNLPDSEIGFNFLELSEEHYRESRWADCIANSRKFLELALQNIAYSYSINFLNIPLAKNTLERPVLIREFLMDQKLLEKKEKEALDKIYGLLSHTGSHPYMAEKDQARLLRQLSLTFSQFVLLRYEGRCAKP